MLINGTIIMPILKLINNAFSRVKKEEPITPKVITGTETVETKFSISKSIKNKFWKKKKEDVAPVVHKIEKASANQLDPVEPVTNKKEKPKDDLPEYEMDKKLLERRRRHRNDAWFLVITAIITGAVLYPLGCWAILFPFVLFFAYSLWSTDPLPLYR